MDWRAVLYTLAHLTLILALCLLAPLVVAIIYYGDNPNGGWEIAAFVVPLVLSLGGGLWMRRYSSSVDAR